MHIEVGPIGRLSTGHVLDVNKKGFEEALRMHDPQLYVKWNPKKLRGWGCWEIRRRPNFKVPVDYSVTHSGDTIFRMEYKENNLLHHVLDCAFLNYDQIRKIKEIDTWTNADHFVHDLDYKERKQQEEVQAKAKKELAYAIKQNKKVFEAFRELVQSGHNPARIVLGEDI